MGEDGQFSKGVYSSIEAVREGSCSRLMCMPVSVTAPRVSGEEKIIVSGACVLVLLSLAQ